MSAESFHPGKRLGRYELIRPIARGGMATVWAARLMGPRGFQKIVAIKVMLRALRDEPGVDEMFLAEARIASLIRHPNVVEVSDLGDEGGCLHLVMEWVHGAPLTEVVAAAAKRGGMSVSLGTRIVRQVCAGLAAAHGLTDERGTPLGLVHRDVSPHNVLVGFNGVVKVADFGIAKVRSASANETQFGQIKGKIAYMAPEQLRFEPVDQRTDVFAVGILLYLLTTGVHPFKHDEQHETVRALLSTDPVRAPSAFLDGYPSRLERVVLKALAKEPEDRYASVEALDLDLAAATPPSTKGVEALQDYVRELLPDSYREGIELARAASEPLTPLTASSSVLQAQPKGRSSSTLRAVAVSLDGPAAATEHGSEMETARWGDLDGASVPVAGRRGWAPVVAFAGLGATIALVAAVSWSARSARSGHAGSPSAEASVGRAPAPELVIEKQVGSVGSPTTGEPPVIPIEAVAAPTVVAPTPLRDPSLPSALPTPAPAALRIPGSAPARVPRRARVPAASKQAGAPAAGLKDPYSL